MIQILGSHKPALNDIITGELDKFGGVVLDNKSQHQHFSADIHDFACDQRRMDMLMGR
ncbi:MAG: hypothetical protein R3E68_03710 [Burkholderiaceae bacterium]